MAITAKQITDLNKMNVASQRAGGLGTLLLGGANIPSAGSLSLVNTLKYTTTPALGTATYVHAAIALTSGAQTGYASGTFTNPDVPRVVTVKGNASGITGNVVVHGTDFAGAALSDTIALNGATEVSGAVAFKTVTSVDLPAETHSGTDTVSIGVDDVIGFPCILDNTNNLLSADFNGSVDAGSATAATTVKGSLYTPAGTLDGAKALELTFILVG